MEDAGHQVIYACPWDVREKVEKQGFTYLQLDEINFDPAPALPEFTGRMAVLKQLWTRIKKVKKRRREAVRSLGMEKFTEVLKEIKPDLLLIDMELHDLIITAVSKKYQTALLSQWFSTWKSPGLPPITKPIIPNGNRFEIETAWLIADLKRLLLVAGRRLYYFFSDRPAILRLYAKQSGFPTGELSERYRFPPITYRTLPVLSLNARELEFPHKNPRPNLFYVGPMVFENRRDIKTDPETEKKLQEIFEDKKKRNHKLLYCSISTMHENDGRFIRKLVTAVAGKKDWQMIIGLGGSSRENFSSEFPENVHAFEWVSQIEVLKHADCSINHGGIHTINECLHFGVPMLIYSGKRFDQNGCAARVDYHGLGIMADKDSDDHRKIQKRITEILENPAYKSKVNEIRSKIAKAENKLVKVVEDLLKS